jgi:hypothetical protein
MEIIFIKMSGICFVMLTAFMAYDATVSVYWKGWRILGTVLALFQAMSLIGLILVI